MASDTRRTSTPAGRRPFEVRNRSGQTAITVYPRSRGVYVFRYYLGG